MIAFREKRFKGGDNAHSMPKNMGHHGVRAGGRVSCFYEGCTTTNLDILQDLGSNPSGQVFTCTRLFLLRIQCILAVECLQRAGVLCQGVFGP